MKRYENIERMQFEGVGEYGIPMLQQFRYVLIPDFSLYTDFPKALQIWNHYRKHWIGAYMQLYGIDVIPTIAWNTEERKTGRSLKLKNVPV